MRVGFLWGLALLGLLLLPSDYRAGAETAHGHAQMQLWLDAADGTVLHHHGHGAQGAAWDWLEPSAAGTEEAGFFHAGASRPDVGELHDSAPAPGNVHLLIGSVALFMLATARLAAPTAPWLTPVGRAVPVLLPPPRLAPLAG